MLNVGHGSAHHQGFIRLSAPLASPLTGDVSNHGLLLATPEVCLVPVPFNLAFHVLNSVALQHVARSSPLVGVFKVQIPPSCRVTQTFFICIGCVRMC